MLDRENLFCKPYRSWENGGVGNYNGLVRQYFPKGHDFATIPRKRLQEGEDEISTIARETSCAYQSVAERPPRPLEGIMSTLSPAAFAGLREGLTKAYNQPD